MKIPSQWFSSLPKEPWGFTMFVGCPGRVLDIRNLVTAQSETSIIAGLGLRTGSSTSSYLWVQASRVSPSVRL
jgi:hypothetical protein